MSIGNLPPLPLGDIKNFPYTFQEWLRKINNILASSGISWSLIDFTGSNLTDIQTRNHNDLQNIQGGQAGEYYHLTLAEYNDLGNGDVTGPASSGDGNVVLFDGLTGKIIKDGGTPSVFVSGAGYWSPLTDGNVSAPQLIFSGGDTIMCWVPA